MSSPYTMRSAKDMVLICQACCDEVCDGYSGSCISPFVVPLCRSTIRSDLILAAFSSRHLPSLRPSASGRFHHLMRKGESLSPVAGEFCVRFSPAAGEIPPLTRASEYPPLASSIRSVFPTELVPCCGAELLQDGVHMRLDGLICHMQSSRDLGIGASVGE